MKYAIWVYTYFNATDYEKGKLLDKHPTGEQALTMEIAQRQLKKIQDDHHWCKRHREGENWISFRNMCIYHYQIEENNP